MVVLDTTVLIDLERGSAKAAALIARLGPPLRVPAVVWAEFLRNLPGLQRQRAAARLEAAVVFEPFDRELADEAARLWYDLAEEGRVLSQADLQVAATALRRGEPLVSNDVSFRQVPGLDLKSH